MLTFTALLEVYFLVTDQQKKMLLDNGRFWSKTVNKSGVSAEQKIRATGAGARNTRIPEIRTAELALACSIVESAQL